MNKRTKLIERITLTGPSDEIEKAFDYCSANGFRKIYVGAPQKEKYVYDFSRYKIIAEREKEG